MKQVVLAAAILVGCQLAVSAQQSNGGVIYGPDWSYLIIAPQGFKWDSTSLRKEYILGLFYKKDQAQYEGNKLNMYINPVRKGDGYPTNVDELIKWDTDYFKSKNPGLVVTYYKDLPLGDKKLAKVYKFDDDSRGYYMLSGYVTESKCSFVFVLSARSREERAKYESAYADLLSSFIYIKKI